MAPLWLQKFTLAKRAPPGFLVRGDSLSLCLYMWSLGFYTNLGVHLSPLRFMSLETCRKDTSYDLDLAFPPPGRRAGPCTVKRHQNFEIFRQLFLSEFLEKVDNYKLKALENSQKCLQMLR